MSGVPGALLRYRIMAYVVGVFLLILVCVGIPLQYAADQPAVVHVVGPIHGFLYIVYLAAAVDLARRAKLTLLQLALMVGAGFIPLLAFFIEHWVTRRVNAQLSAAAVGGI